MEPTCFLPKVRGLSNPSPRWEYRHDRRDFTRWLRANRVSSCLDYYFDGQNLTLRLYYHRKERQFRGPHPMSVRVIPALHLKIDYRVSWDELNLSSFGWRGLTARCIRLMRAQMRRDVEARTNAA